MLKLYIGIEFYFIIYIDKYISRCIYLMSELIVNVVRSFKRHNK